MPIEIPATRPWITARDKRAVASVLSSGNLMTGDRVAEFEEGLQAYLGRKYVVCVNSGTAAVSLALKATASSQFLVSAFSFIATANAAETTGEILFTDKFSSLPSDYSKECVFVPSYMLGEVENIENAQQRIVADACQAFGSKTLPKTLADCYSFNANKPITTWQGGCVATDSEQLAECVRELRDQGRGVRPDGKGRYLTKRTGGGNFRMGEANAALGLSQLQRIDEIMRAREEVAEMYSALLPEGPLYFSRESWFMYPLEVEGPALAASVMAKNGVQVRTCYDLYALENPAFSHCKLPETPVSAWRAMHTLLLPIYPQLTFRVVKRIVDAFRSTRVSICEKSSHVST